MVQKLTKITPDLAKKLTSKLHPRQRKLNKVAINKYARRLENGWWKDGAPTQPMLVDKETGELFNGLQRCMAVIETGVPMEVWLDLESDAEEYFAVIDDGLARKAHQFINKPRATIRASAARIMLWYRNNFNDPLGSQSNYIFSPEEIVTEAESLEVAFDNLMHLAVGVYDRTGISAGTALAALTLAEEDGAGEAAIFFAEKVIDPQGLSIDDPAWRLVDRQSKQIHRIKHRQPMEDWTLFVRHLNAEITGDKLPSKISGTTKLWPAVGETEQSFARRNKTARIISTSNTMKAIWAAKKEAASG